MFCSLSCGLSTSSLEVVIQPGHGSPSRSSRGQTGPLTAGGRRRANMNNNNSGNTGIEDGPHEGQKSQAETKQCCVRCYGSEECTELCIGGLKQVLYTEEAAPLTGQLLTTLRTRMLILRQHEFKAERTDGFGSQTSQHPFTLGKCDTNDTPDGDLDPPSNGFHAS